MTTEDEAPDAPRTGPIRPLGTAQQLTEDTARRLISAIEASAPVKHIRANQIFSALLATVGAALVFSGIEIMVQNTSYLDNGWGAVVLGLVMLFVSGLMLQKLIKGE
jgi:hypothetical protein